MSKGADPVGPAQPKRRKPEPPEPGWVYVGRDKKLKRRFISPTDYLQVRSYFDRCIFWIGYTGAYWALEGILKEEKEKELKEMNRETIEVRASNM
jgi:hypothetical protein